MPWLWSAAARLALSGDHTAVSRVEVWHSGRPSGVVLEVTGGSVSIDADRPVRRNLSCTLVDSTGTLTRGDVDDLLNPYDCEVAPYRGVRIFTVTSASALVPNAGFGVQPFGTSGFGGTDAVATSIRSYRDELAPQGVFGLTARDVQDSPDGLTIRLTGQDRAMGYQGPMASALALDGGTAIEVAIARLLAARNPGVSLLAMSTGFTTGPLLFAPDIDVWREAQNLAQSVGARLFHDRTGQCVLALAGPASDRPVAVYEEGDGLLLNLSRVEDSDTIHNQVIAETPDGSIRAIAEDTDPTSPTFTGGRYGNRPVTLPNQHYGSVEQAQQAATAALAWELGRSETVTFEAVPDSARDVEEVVTVHRPRAGLDHRGVVIATVEMPLGVTETMKVGCRQSRLAQDGRALPLVKQS